MAKMTKMASVTHKPSHRRRVGEGISRKRSCAASGGRGSWPAFPVPEAFADSLVSSHIRWVGAVPSVNCAPLVSSESTYCSGGTQ